MVEMIESLFQTHRPIWDHSQQLLKSFFMTEERRRVLKQAKQYLEENAPAGMADPERWAQRVVPDERPNWDFATEEGQVCIQRYQDALLAGVKAGAKRPMNMAKFSSVVQEANETPGDFYERLCEAYRVYIPFDPEAAANQHMVSATLVAQAAPDIRRKLQKLKGLARMNNIQHLDIAHKVYTNQDVTAEQEARRVSKEKAALLAATLKDTKGPGP